MSAREACPGQRGFKARRADPSRRGARSTWSLIPLLLLAGMAPAAQQSGDAVLARHAQALGDTTARAAAGDIELTGRIEGVHGARRWRMSLRLDPASMREELDHGDAQGVAIVASAHRAWSAPRETGTTGEAGTPRAVAPPLPAGVSVAVTDRLNEMRLMLSPLRFSGSVDVDASSVSLPATPGWPREGEQAPDDIAPGRAVTTLLLANPASLIVQAHFDRETGLLIGLDQPWTLTRPWVRLSAWRKVGGVLLPTRRLAGSEVFPPSTTIVEDARAALSLPDELFAGDPYVPRTAPAVIAPLEVTPFAIPGTGYILLRDVRANGQAAATIFDTAADGVFLKPSLAQSLGLGMFAAQTSQTLFGSVSTSVHQLGLLEIGSERLHQLPAFGAELPQLATLLSSQQPRIAIGGWPIMQLHPVLDLRGGRLVAREPRPVPLAAVTAGSSGGGEAAAPRGTRFEILLSGEADERGAHVFLIDVASGPRVARVLLDTGMPSFLRLSASGLRRLGLPTTRAFWAARGAAVMPLAGAGGQAGADLLVRVKEMQVGPITYEAPYVLLAGLGDADEALEFSWDGLLGAAALLPFDRVGFDGVRGVLELEVAGDAVGPVRDSDGKAARRTSAGVPRARVVDGGLRVVVGDPGLMPGFFLRANGPEDGGAPPLLPSVFAVQPRSPAAGVGIRVGDRLARIDGASIAGVPLGQIVPSLWLEPGRDVILTFARVAAGDASGKIEWLDVRLP